MPVLLSFNLVDLISSKLLLEKQGAFEMTRLKSILMICTPVLLFVCPILTTGPLDSSLVEKSPEYLPASPTILWVSDEFTSMPTLFDLNGDLTPDIITEYGRVINGSNGVELWHKQISQPGNLPALITEVNSDFHFDVIFSGMDEIEAYDGRWGIKLWTWTTDDFINDVIIANVVGNIRRELVVGCREKTYLLSDRNGSLVWEVDIGLERLAVADITGDSELEVIGTTKNQFHVILADGSLLWSKEIGIYEPGVQFDVFSKPALGDIDNDGVLEIVAACRNGYVYAFDALTGNIEWQFGPLTSLNGLYSGSPSLGDIDGDGRLEVVFTNGTIYAINGESGTLLWMYDTGTLEEPTFRSATIADISGDRRLDVLIGGDDLYAIDGLTGESLWTFSTDSVAFNPVVADITGDGLLEVIVWSGDLYALSIPDAGNRVYWQSYDGSEWFTRVSCQQDFDPDFDMLSIYTERFSSHTLLECNDSDSDGCSDAWEFMYNFNPNLNQNPNGTDSDEDGLNDLEEAQAFSNPHVADSDNDQLSDYQEVKVYFTDPMSPDSDHDLLNDAEEVLYYETDPLSSDSDSDEMPDGWEALNSLDPLRADAFEDFDSDGLLNIYELLNGTRPQFADTDKDGITDGWEVSNGYDPLDSLVPLDELLIWFSPFIVGFICIISLSGYIFSIRLARKLRMVDKISYEPNMNVQILVGLISSIGVSILLYPLINNLLLFMDLLIPDNRFSYAIFRMAFLQPITIAGTGILTCVIATVLGVWSGLDENLIRGQKFSMRQLCSKVCVGIARDSILALKYVLPIVLFIGYITAILGIGFPIVQFRSEGLEPYFTVAFFISTGIISLILLFVSIMIVSLVLTGYVIEGYAKSIPPVSKSKKKDMNDDSDELSVFVPHEV